MTIDGTSVALIGAGLTAGLSAVGSAWGVGLAGKATSAVLSEKPIFRTDACASGSARYAGVLRFYSYVSGARKN